MRNALILHGTSSNSDGNWFPWLKKELEKIGWNVWVPDLPDADRPNVKKYNKFMFNNKNWKFDSDSVLIGHSSGAVAILGLLQHLPPNVKVDTCILVGAFKNDLSWPNLRGLFEETFNLEFIKKKAKRFVFIHSKDDPHCPPEQAEYLAKRLGGKLIMKEKEGHFNLEKGPKYKKFPLILKIVRER